MQQKYEIIKYEESLPINILLHRIGNVRKHWHKSIELLFVLEGQVELTVNDKQYTLEDEDIYLINSNELHELSSQDAILIAIQIELNDMNLPDSVQNINFNCNSMTQPEKPFNTIRQIVANMVFTNAHNDDSTYARNFSLAYSLIAELLRHFKGEQQENIFKTEKHLNRLSNILNFIKENYQNNLTLNEIAEREHLSAPYLSTFFDKYIGMNFSTYYDKLRVEYAVNDLITSDLSIEEIAIKHGFSETRSFLRAFKKEYKTLPSIYRKEQRVGTANIDKDNQLVNYMEFEPSIALEKLDKYFIKEQEHSKAISQKNYFKSIHPISIEENKRPLQHTAKTFTSVGRAKELLYSEVQEMLTSLQQSVSFEYIKFHGLFSDDLLVVKRKPNGELSFSFILIDKVLDFLQSINLKPLIQLSFMPEDMASVKDKTVFASQMNTSLPKDLDEWTLLVRTFIHHIQERYGRKTIETWLYCVWNEPDTSYNMFGVGDDKKFYQFYKKSYTAVKQVNSKLQFGSPSLLLITSINMEWAIDFLKWTKKENCTPEFLNLHYYGDDFENTSSDNSLALPYKTKLSLDDQNLNKYIDQVKLMQRDLDMNHLPVYLTEWNLTVSHRNLINDTLFVACYLVKNILSNYDRLDSFGYWSLTDFIEEFQLDNDLFHGGLGLFTYNGIKKPHFYAFEFISWLGDDLIDSGDGYFITKDNDRIKLILYNYEHYNKAFADGYSFTMTPSNRYTAFSKNLSVDLLIPFENMSNQNYLIKEYSVNQKQGSALDQWIRMGSHDLNNPYDLNLLKQSTVPYLNQYKHKVDKQSLNYYNTLEPLEIKYVEIIPVEV